MKVLQTLEGDIPCRIYDEKIDNKKDPFPMGVSETSSSAAGAGPFDVLRNSPEFQAFRDMVQANPHLLQPMLQEWEKENPPLWRLIQENRANFFASSMNLLKGGILYLTTRLYVLIAGTPAVIISSRMSKELIKIFASKKKEPVEGGEGNILELLQPPMPQTVTVTLRNVKQ
ncbi:hypothetical protein GH714_035156 [Hevea brasiliensis]|uniref:STI1 domain-containing protein n=1 Tax=Hevea brasiliensis TaxID=3981 RepID=A0A6A6NCE6_HEVBR|nr:hypothetical protein GH714_035156 [Hevea brasiliensis]